MIEYLCITLTKFKNKFKWALDRDIQCMVTKFTILTAFWQCFAHNIVLYGSKNFEFLQHLFLHVLNDIYPWIQMKNCLTILIKLKNWKNDWTSSFLGNQALPHLSESAGTFLTSCGANWWNMKYRSLKNLKIFKIYRCSTLETCFTFYILHLLVILAFQWQCSEVSHDQ